jgi:hypothetical protein
LTLPIGRPERGARIMATPTGAFSTGNGRRATIAHHAADFQQQ